MRILREYFRPRRTLSGGGRRPGERCPAGHAYFSGPSAAGRRPSLSSRAGVSLVELMIALAILTIGIVALMGTFSFIQKAVQLSKNKTLASNLAQEKMQILKQKSYYQVIVTSDPDHNTTDFAPDVLDYDSGYFPPENVTEAGVTYTRYTYVQLVKEDGGVLMDLAPNIPDTGMKRITVTVVWGTPGGKRKVSIRSILANPDTVLTNVIFNGVVRTTDTTPAPLYGALVRIVEGAGWSDTCDAGGNYLINATPGTYTLQASSAGYYTSMKVVAIAAGATLTTNFNLMKIATGRIAGFPWLTDHLVISQVVGSTVNASYAYDQEYVEVFNPTTYTWTLNGQVGLKFRRSADTSEQTISIDYRTQNIDPGEYFLFANTGTVNAGGVVMPADAVWTSTNSTTSFPYFATQANIIPVENGTAAEIANGEGGGAIKLYQILGGKTLDSVGWNKDFHPAPFYETTAIPQNAGLSRNELYARITSTSDTAGVNPAYGPAYDSNDNSDDFSDYLSITLPPHNSNTTAKPIISGTPAVGAVVSCSDSVSASTTAILMTNPSPNFQTYAYFSLMNVATGTWAVVISSGLFSLETSTFPVPNAGSVYTLPSSTTFLTQDSTKGVISGRVQNVYGNALNGMVVASDNGGLTNTGTDGLFRLRVNPGVVNVTANQSPTSSYVSASSESIPIKAGEVHSGTDFVLYQGGRVSGFITRDGTNGLPGVSVVILDANSIARDNQVSDSGGRFTSVILSTGYYIAQPAIGDLESSNPISSTVTVLTMGGTVFSSTFTISGALGYITGTVTKGGQPIKTGVLIVVTTATLTGTPPVPPDLSSATITGSPFYLFSSMEDGTYRAEVRNGTAYRVYAYYPVAGSTGTAIYSANTTGISVTAGATTSGVNFSW